MQPLVFVHQPALLRKLFVYLGEGEQQQLCQKLFSLQLLEALAQGSQGLQALTENSAEFALRPLDNTVVGVQSLPKQKTAIQFKKQEEPGQLKYYVLRDDKKSDEQLLILQRHFFISTHPGYNVMIPYEPKWFRVPITQFVGQEPLTPDILFAAFPKQAYVCIENVQTPDQFRQFIIKLLGENPSTYPLVDKFLTKCGFIPVQAQQRAQTQLETRLFFVFNDAKSLPTTQNIRSLLWLALIVLDVQPKTDGQTQIINQPFAPEYNNKVLRLLCTQLHTAVANLKHQDYNLDINAIVESTVTQSTPALHKQILRDIVQRLLNVTPNRPPQAVDASTFIESLVRTRGDVAGISQLLRDFEAGGDVGPVKAEQRFSFHGSRLDQSLIQRDDSGLDVDPFFE